MNNVYLKLIDKWDHANALIVYPVTHIDMHHYYCIIGG